MSYFPFFSSFCLLLLVFFFFNDTATTEIYPLSLHDALPISARSCAPKHAQERAANLRGGPLIVGQQLLPGAPAGVAHPARESQQLGTALRNAIDRTVADDPQPRLQAAQEAVAPGERRVVLGGGMALLQ